MDVGHCLNDMENRSVTAKSLFDMDSNLVLIII